MRQKRIGYKPFKCVIPTVEQSKKSKILTGTVTGPTITMKMEIILKVLDKKRNVQFH